MTEFFFAGTFEVPFRCFPWNTLNVMDDSDNVGWSLSYLIRYTYFKFIIPYKNIHLYFLLHVPKLHSQSSESRRHQQSHWNSITTAYSASLPTSSLWRFLYAFFYLFSGKQGKIHKNSSLCANTKCFLGRRTFSELPTLLLSIVPLVLRCEATFSLWCLSGALCGNCGLGMVICLSKFV